MSLPLQLGLHTELELGMDTAYFQAPEIELAELQEIGAWGLRMDVKLAGILEALASKLS